VVKIFWRTPHRGGRIFHGEKLMWHWPVGSTAVGCSRTLMPLLTFFAAYTAAVTHNAFFQWAENPQNCLFPLGDLDPHLIHGFLGPPEYSLKSVSWSVRPFCRAHERDQQTDRYTDRLRYSVCSNRPHLATAAMRPTNAHTVFVGLAGAHCRNHVG